MGVVQKFASLTQKEEPSMNISTYIFLCMYVCILKKNNNRNLEI